MAKRTKTTSEEIVENLESPLKENSSQDTKADNDSQNNENIIQDAAVDNTNTSTQLDITDEDITLLLEAGHKPEDLEKASLEKLATMVADLKKQGQTQSFVVSEDLATRIGGIAKSFVGKDVTELFKAITEQNSYIGKLQAQIQQLEARLQSQQVVDKKGSVDKEDVGSAVNIGGQDIEALVESVLLKKMPQLKVIEQKSQEQLQAEIIARVKAETNVEDPLVVIRDFGSQLNNDEIAYYTNNPDKFIRDVVKHYKQKTLEAELEQLKKERRHQTNLEIARKVRLALAQKGNESNVSHSNIPPSDNNDATLKTVKEILGNL